MKREEPFWEMFNTESVARSTWSAGLSPASEPIIGAADRNVAADATDPPSFNMPVPALRNIVFFKYVHSPISFYQMVGRGTRIDVPTGKLMFR